MGAHYEPSSGMKILYVRSIFRSNWAMIFRKFGLALPITIWNRLIGHAKQKTYYVLLKKSPFSKTPFKKNKLYPQVLYIHYWALYKSYLLKEWRDYTLHNSCSSYISFKMLLKILCIQNSSQTLIIRDVTQKVQVFRLISQQKQIWLFNFYPVFLRGTEGRKNTP